MGILSLSNLLPYDGEIYFFRHFFSESRSLLYQKLLEAEVKWEQHPIKIFGQQILQPRLTAWQSDPNIEYRYSGLTLKTKAWTKTVEKIRREVEKVAGVSFNGVLLNQYRYGKDSMGWHRDNEKELGPTPVIGSVSFGATRKFQLRHYSEKNAKVSIELTQGSLLIMKGQTQHFWEHSIAKTTKPVGPRINLTFRRVRSDGSFT